MSTTNGDITSSNPNDPGLTQSTIPTTIQTNTHRSQDPDIYHPATLSIHADDPLNIHTDVAPPLHVSTTFRYTSDPTQLRPFRASHRPNAPNFPHQETPSEHCYSRLTTHTTTRLEAILTSLLKNPTITYSSGLSALHALLTHLVPKNVAIGAGYHGSRGVLRLHTRLTALKVHPLDCPDDVLQKGDLIILETPINPTGLALDISHYAAKAHEAGAYLFVDSTFAPPPLQDPFVHGADIVMHSGTKYIGGHSDMLCGVLAVRRELAEPGREGGEVGWMSQLLEDREFIGNVMGGLEGWLGVRSVRTLELRVMRQSVSATRLVKAFQAGINAGNSSTSSHNGTMTKPEEPLDPLLTPSNLKLISKVVSKVQHASLQTTDLESGWLSKQMPNGFGPVFALTLKSSELARHLPSKLHLFHHATSLGGVESLIEWRTMTDSTVGADVLRVSVGVEEYGDLLGDFLQAFERLEREFGL